MNQLFGLQHRRRVGSAVHFVAVLQCCSSKIDYVKVEIYFYIYIYINIVIIIDKCESSQQLQQLQHCNARQSTKSGNSTRRCPEASGSPLRADSLSAPSRTSVRSVSAVRVFMRPQAVYFRGGNNHGRGGLLQAL
jgi:hypothetical protein